MKLSYCYVVMQILWNAYNDNDLPMFHNLSSLKINGNPWLCSKCYAWHAIYLLLSRAPKLQVLVFELHPHCLRSCYAPKDQLEEPLDVPECLSSHLTTCHYKTLLGKNFEMEIVRKILKAARVLKTMNITVESHLSSKAKLRICQKLMKFRRSSKTCQITFE